MTKYKAGDKVIVKSFRQAGEGNGVIHDNTRGILIAKEDVFYVRDKWGSKEYYYSLDGEDYRVTGMFEVESDWVVMWCYEGYPRFSHIPESHIISKVGSFGITLGGVKHEFVKHDS